MNPPPQPRQVPLSISEERPRLQEWDYYDVLTDDGDYTAVRVRLIGGHASNCESQADQLYLKTCNVVERRLFQKGVNQRIILKISDAIKVNFNGEYLFVGGTIYGPKNAVNWALNALRVAVSEDSDAMDAYAKRTPFRVANWEPPTEICMKERKHISVPRVEQTKFVYRARRKKNGSLQERVERILRTEIPNPEPVLKIEIIDGDFSHMD